MIALFILKLSAGITLMWWLMPRRDVTDGFFRIQMRVLLGLAVLSALLLSGGADLSVGAPEAPVIQVRNRSMETGEFLEPEARQTSPDVAAQAKIIAIAVAVIAFAGSVFWALGRRLPGNACIHLLTLLTAVSLGLHSWNAATDCGVVQQLLSDFSSAAVLGGVTTGMLLGHWYLTTPTMSIRPLTWFNIAIAVAVLLRLVASGWAVADAGISLSDTTQQMWLGIRWAGGIVVPGLMSVMVWRILKHRNTQSATGVLFATLVVVFMGEMAAGLLEQDVRIPY
ncbi:MAG TPA: hypothetical protein EYG03_27190 [Planctomycetes bacterium]|nr:hypothetical protein [Fuerstiella sp.]HIK95649.1 hypothetical protein [Planctomycetota bacterium]